MTSVQSYTLDDIHSDVTHLAHLIDETMSKLLEIDQRSLEEETKHYVDRASAFTWVARDLVEHIRDGFSRALRDSGAVVGEEKAHA
jgi:ABC-type iron transport system FetAB ATPase subunit